jgi:hypothetical protein
MSSLLKILVASIAALGMAQANAGILKVTEAAFVAGSGLITFSEFAVNTINPTYLPAKYGGNAGSPTVTFDGFFAGQSLGNTCGGAATGCVVDLNFTSNPLSLAAGAPDTFITTDSANLTSPVLSGSPRFNGPIGILFSTDQAGVGLDGGFFDAIGGTAITAFARDGSLLGSVKNETLVLNSSGWSPTMDRRRLPVCCSASLEPNPPVLPSTTFVSARPAKWLSPASRNPPHWPCWALVWLVSAGRVARPEGRSLPALAAWA